MCLVALFFRVAEDAPVVLGANREEFFARPGEPPRVWEGPCRFLAGRDSLAGGTWLGVNEHGVLVAVSNRRKTDVPFPSRSRGLLVLDALACKSAAAAVELATKELDQNRYAGCNLVIADAERAVVLHGGDWLRVRPLPPGLHVLANGDVNDESDPRVGHALGWLYRQPYSVAEDCLAALQELCSNPGRDSPPICLTGPDRGTVSSTLIALRRPLTRSIYRHAQGPPDRTPYEDYSSLFDPLTAPRES
jgi:uncharacterized protein with NRDE domain